MQKGDTGLMDIGLLERENVRTLECENMRRENMRI